MTTATKNKEQKVVFWSEIANFVKFNSCFPMATCLPKYGLSFYKVNYFRTRYHMVQNFDSGKFYESGLGKLWQVAKKLMNANVFILSPSWSSYLMCAYTTLLAIATYVEWNS